MSDEQEYPLVSVILLAGNSPLVDISRSIHCFRSQTYPRRELIIVPTTDDQYEVLCHRHRNESDIRVLEAVYGESVGASLNVAMRHAGGPISARFDIDYWYAPARISTQVATMASQSSHISVLASVLSYSCISGRARLATNEKRCMVDTMVWIRNSDISFPNMDYGVMAKMLDQMMDNDMRPISMEQPQLCCRLILSHERGKATPVNVDLEPEHFELIRGRVIDTI